MTPAGPPAARLAVLQDPALVAAMEAHPIRELVTIEGPYPAYADRPRALFSSWYEFFPRSEGATLDADGTVVERHLPDRGQAARRGGRDGLRRHLPAADPPDRRGQPQGPQQHARPRARTTPAHPWAIGSKDGGHDAIHPDLGTLDDFDAFVARARELGLEVALDLALQCAPDHPWVTSHPELFTTRLDGTIAYAENPPKKYQDIYPINFDNDPVGICREVLRVVKHWMSHGVRIFRVDNPHTKPVAFWEWLLKEIRRTDPDVLFLSEAFTRPADDARARRGRLPPELHLLHLAQRQVGARGLPPRGLPRVRPHRCGRTSSSTPPTSSTPTCSTAGRRRSRSAPRSRRPGSPSWGVYAGYELFEHVAVRPGSEEYLD